VSGRLIISGVVSGRARRAHQPSAEIAVARPPSDWPQQYRTLASDALAGVLVAIAALRSLEDGIADTEQRIGQRAIRIAGQGSLDRDPAMRQLSKRRASLVEEASVIRSLLEELGRYA
jgi:hypothetical protein